MRKIRLVIAYDGSRYAGWQRQKNAITIQGVIEDAIWRLTGERSPLLGAGRTDGGVHALGQVAVFRTGSNIPLEGMMRALNTLLPLDIRILEASAVDNRFHPIRDALSKHYRYLISEAREPHPLNQRRVWHIGANVDIGLMRRAASALIGRHDFSTIAPTDGRPIKEIKRLDISDITGSELLPLSMSKDARLIDIEIEADGFLRHMVRIIVGILVEVGKKRLGIPDVEAILDGRSSRRAIVAPPWGLYLVKVDY